MGKFRYRKTIGSKHVKANIGKNGVNSFTFKFGPISYNTKSGKTTLKIFKGLSYVFGNNKKK